MLFAVSLVSSEKLNPILISDRTRMMTNIAMISSPVIPHIVSPIALIEAQSVVSDQIGLRSSPIGASIPSLTVRTARGEFSCCLTHKLKILANSMIKMSPMLSIPTTATGCIISHKMFCQDRYLSS